MRKNQTVKAFATVERFKVKRYLFYLQFYPSTLSLVFDVQLMRIRDDTSWFNTGVQQRISYNLCVGRSRSQLWIIECSLLFFQENSTC